MLILFLIAASAFKMKQVNEPVFKTITIGKQEWMIENFSGQMPKSWYYDRDSVANKKYGQLYF